MSLEDKILDESNKLISEKKYHFLRSFKTLTEIEKKQIENFEKHYLETNAEYVQKQVDYWKDVFADKPKIIFAPTFEQIRDAFIKKYKEVAGKEFVLNYDSESNLDAICTYFSQDERFFNCKNVSKISEPNFEKGLLIVGGYGNGKTSFIETFQKLFSNTPLAFAFISTNDLVEEFECIKEMPDKEIFWKKNTTKPRCFDDCKTERIASNFGKVNVMKDVLEKRYSSKVKTYITCNYNELFPNNLDEAVKELGIKYGHRVYDRLFEMFNIIEFKGKSFRK